MGFLYFIPDTKPSSITSATLRDIGLDHLASVGFVIGEVLRGPNGRSGSILIRKRVTSQVMLKYNGDSQAWKKSPGHDWHIGWSSDGMPGPDDLQRDNVFPGQAIKLGDGRYWQIPLVRGLADDDDGLIGFCALPTKRSLDEDGKWTCGDPVGVYAELYTLALEYWSNIFNAIREMLVPENATDGQAMTTSFETETTLAAKAIAANYAVGDVEIDVLGLLDDATTRDVLNATVDWPKAMEWIAKKKVLSGLTTDAG